MPSMGPSAMAITTSAMPSISFINADVITKNPPKDKLTNNLVLLCSQSTHSSLDL
jgi:fructoselysine-6-P-deglycase FrlB-like protein